jgi:hypothetical protein
MGLMMSKSKSLKMRCISRITEDTYCQNFGNGHNKFYIELRCNLPCNGKSDICSKCSIKSASCKTQSSRRFNHGKVTEPIPDDSHIYGGKWYLNSVKKYGEPNMSAINLAEEYQRTARADSSSSSNSMTSEVEIKPTKTRKPKVAPDEASTQMTDSTTKKRTKPRVAPETDSASESKSSVSRKKHISTPYTSLVNNTTKLVHKEVSIPTHIETKLDEIITEGFEIEHVQLSLFEANGTTYFRDSKKNKLYKKIKDKIGPYVGRWNPDTDSVLTDIPDSDDEN